MKKKVVFAIAGLCLVAIMSILSASFAYTSQFDLTKLNHLSWNGSLQTDNPPIIDGTKLKLSVKKQFSSEQPSEQQLFTFELKALKDNSPMPAGASGGSFSFTINGAGELILPEINYTASGKYTYTVSELDTAAAGYTYDTSVYTVTVTVENEGGLKISGTEISMSKNGKIYSNLSEVVFTNSYAPADKTGELPKMSDSFQPELYCALLAASVLGFIGCCVYLIIMRKKSRYEKK